MNNNWIFAIVLVLATTVSTHVSPQNDFERGLVRVLERWRSGDVEGMAVKLPPLNRISLGSRQIQRDGYTMDLRGVVVWGLEKVSVSKLSADAPRKEILVQFSVPTLYVTADYYHLSGGYFLFRINDRGAFQATVSNLRAAALVRLGGDAPRVYVDYAVDDVQTYLSGSSDFVNGRFTNKLARMLADKDRVIQRAQTMVEAALTRMLERITPDQLVDAISKA